MTLGDKNLKNSATIGGAAIVGGVQAAETLGLVPPGMGAQILSLIQIIGGMLAVFGFRRAVGSNGIGALDEGEEIVFEDEA